VGSNLSAGAFFRPESWTQPLPLEDMFDMSRPLEVDVGCGKGRFLLARATANPEINYLGIDRMLRRIRKVDRKIGRLGLTNVRIVRVEASYAIEHALPLDSVSAAYIFFPDPWPKRRHLGRRMFNQDFLDSLHGVLKVNAEVHVATDHIDYFDSIRAILRADPRFEQIPTLQLTDDERTDFERLFMGQDKPIGRGSFVRRPSVPESS
jgi:tRNA (guanine-N7-)-methyltransferase